MKVKITDKKTGKELKKFFYCINEGGNEWIIDEDNLVNDDNRESEWIKVDNNNFEVEIAKDS